MALVDSFLDVAIRSGMQLAPQDQDQYIKEMVDFARLVGIDPNTVPSNTQELKSYFENIAPELSASDDAKRVVDLGATALSVSNHGGNNLDGTPAPIRALPAIADAVGSQIDVLLDGGVRRGSDVVKAMALGARAVMIGRAYLWGLAANGQAGVENVLDVIRGGIDSALLGLGKSHVNELTRNDVVAPADFFRKLGA